jgi:hypothetical protein
MSPSDHLLQAHHNALMNSDISLASDFVDWHIITTFYEAVQYIDAFALYREGILPDRHGERFDLIRRLLPDVYADYLTLFDSSVAARYLNNYREFLTSDERHRAHRLRDEELQRIKQAVQNQLASGA